MEIEHLKLMIDARGSELFSKDDFEQFLRNMGYLHSYSLKNQKLVLLQRYEAKYLIGNNRIHDLGLEILPDNIDKGVYVLYPIMKNTYYSSATRKPLMVGDLTQSELYMALKLGVVYREGELDSERVMQMWSLADLTSASETHNIPSYELPYTSNNLNILIEGFKPYISGGIQLVNEGIPIELKGVYNKDKDSILIKDTISQSSKSQALIRCLVQASMSRLTSDGRFYTGAFKGWTIDGTEMLELSESTTRAIIESATYSILSRLRLNTSDCNLSFIGGWEEVATKTQEGKEYIDSLLSHIVSIVDKIVGHIEKILKLDIVDELALESQGERIDELLSAVEANALLYTLGME